MTKGMRLGTVVKITSTELDHFISVIVAMKLKRDLLD